MAFTTMTGTVANHAAIVGDNPNMDGTAFKTLLDKAAVDIVAYINSILLVALEENTLGSSGAENLGCAAIAGVTGTKIRAILVDLKSQIDGVAVGAIPANSLTETQMADDMKKNISGGVVGYNAYVADSSVSTRRDINTHTTIMMGGLI